MKVIQLMSYQILFGCDAGIDEEINRGVRWVRNISRYVDQCGFRYNVSVPSTKGYDGPFNRYN
jgi:hypothetical protein